MEVVVAAEVTEPEHATAAVGELDRDGSDGHLQCLDGAWPIRKDLMQSSDRRNFFCSCCCGRFRSRRRNVRGNSLQVLYLYSSRCRTCSANT